MAAATIAGLCSAIDPARLHRHLAEFARRVKLSGTPEERESFQYLQTCLDSYGLQTKLIEHDAYISLPGKAQFEVGGETPDCITHSYSRPSPNGGLRGQLVYGGAGSSADFSRVDVRGKIVLLENIANPAATLRASQAGALGQVHISPHRHLHEMCISPVWGSPTQEQLELLPKTVVLSIRKAAGDGLKKRLASGESIEVVLHAEVETGWRVTPILQADLSASGADAEDSYVMFSGHHDTWYYGLMDNGGANATMLEIARLFASNRSALKRGLRILFWSGHSHGRYSGSAWYADAYWGELTDRCAAHVNIDSIGAKGNTVLSDALSSAELYGLAAEAVREQGGQELAGRRMSRAGDQSFWGVGIPSVFMAMGEQPLGSENPMAAILGGGGGRTSAGFGWWWHTPEDTLDKIDPEIHVLDTRIYVHTLWRLLTDPVLPLDYERQSALLKAELRGLAEQLDGALDVTALLSRLATLTDRLERARSSARPNVLNRALIRVSRALVPIDYTEGDRFDPGPALGQPSYPVLDPVRRLAATQPRSDEAKFAAVAARRALNRVAYALDKANEALAELEAI